MFYSLSRYDTATNKNAENLLREAVNFGNYCQLSLRYRHPSEGPLVSNHESGN